MTLKYINFSKNIFLSNFKRLTFPYKVTFAVTYRCNSRCKTCNIWAKKTVREMSQEEIESFFKNSNSFSWIDLTGGEPSLRKDFADICETISKYCKNLVLLHFPTNGYLTDKIINDVKRIQSFSSHNKVIITVSIDGDEKLNDEIRGIHGGWKKQIETFVKLRELRNIETVFGITLSPFNFDKFEPTLNSLKNVVPWLTIKDFHISLMNYSEIFYNNLELKDQTSELNDRDKILKTMAQTLKQYNNMIGRPKTPRLFLEYTFLKLAENYLKTGVTPLRCHALKSSCFIDPTGEVYPCITFNQSLGNLRDYGYDLGKIWNLESTKLLQKKIWDLQCPQCWTGCDGYQTILGNLLHLV